MITIENNRECFVELWLRLERTRRLLGMQGRRFCVRRVLQSWLGAEATDEMIWEVCSKAIVDDEQLYGYDRLPPPTTEPRKSREFLKAFVAVKLGIGLRKVNFRALDEAYAEAFPGRKAINVNKSRREP